MFKQVIERLADLSNKYDRIFKVTGIIFFIFYSYIMYHHIVSGLYVERFEGYFLSVVELYLHNKTALDQFAIFPFFDPNMNLDPQLPTRISHMKLSESHYPNFFVLFIGVSLLTGLDPQLLLTIPLGLLFIPILYLNLIRSFVTQYAPPRSSILISPLLFIYYTIYLGVTRYYGSFYVAPVTLGLILICLFLIKKLLTTPDLRYVLLIYISVISLIYYWRSAFMQLFYVICAVFIICLILLGLNRIKIGYLDEANLHYKRILHLFLFSSVLGITFSQLWRNDYLEKFVTEAHLNEFISLALQKFLGQVPFYVPYAYNYKEFFFGKIYFISLQLILFLSLIILVASLLIWLKISLSKKKFTITPPVITGLSIILAQIMLVISYYKTNSLSFPLVPLYFPLFGVAIMLSLSETLKSKFINPKRLRGVIVGIIGTLIVLTLLCNISLNLTGEAGSTSVTKYADAMQSFYWLNEKTIQDAEVIVDFNVIGLYGQLESTGSFFELNYLDLSPDIYQVLVGDVHVNPKVEGRLIVIDHATMGEGLPIHTIFNRAFLKEQISRIGDSPNQSKLYEDKFISVYQFIYTYN